MLEIHSIIYHMCNGLPPGYNFGYILHLHYNLVDKRNAHDKQWHKYANLPCIFQHKYMTDQDP